MEVPDFRRLTSTHFTTVRILRIISTTRLMRSLQRTHFRPAHAATPSTPSVTMALSTSVGRTGPSDLFFRDAFREADDVSTPAPPAVPPITRRPTHFGISARENLCRCCLGSAPRPVDRRHVGAVGVVSAGCRAPCRALCPQSARAHATRAIRRAMAKRPNITTTRFGIYIRGDAVPRYRLSLSTPPRARVACRPRAPPALDASNAFAAICAPSPASAAARRRSPVLPRYHTPPRGPDTVTPAIQRRR